MFGLLICICVCVVVGLALLAVMTRRDDGLAGLLGFSSLMAADVLGAVYAAYSSA